MIRVQIKSDKGVFKALDADTGEPIKGIGKVEVVHNMGTLPIIELSIISTDVGQYSIEGDGTFMAMSTVSGEMKAVKNIEFQDGETIDYGGTT